MKLLLEIKEDKNGKATSHVEIEGYNYEILSNVLNTMIWDSDLRELMQTIITFVNQAGDGDIIETINSLR